MFVYHARPNEIFGNVLYPLKSLKTLNREVFTRERSKYNDDETRKHIPQQYIPKLECTRGEVLNFAPVHPHLIFKAWAELGATLPPQRWLRVPVTHLAGLPAVVSTPHRGAAETDIPDEAVHWLKVKTYQELTELPTATLEWYLELSERVQRGGWFAHVPHVLVKGPVAMNEAEIVDWSTS